MSYRVSWAIDIEADSPALAAREALQIQRDPGFNTATVFAVRDDSDHTTMIDLTEGRQRERCDCSDRPGFDGLGRPHQRCNGTGWLPWTDLEPEEVQHGI